MKNSETYKATDIISGFECRPGLYNLNGASAMFKAVNFTIHSSHATGCSVVLFRRGETKPFAIIPIPNSYRIGDTWSIMIYGLNIYEIEYKHPPVVKKTGGCGKGAGHQCQCKAKKKGEQH